MCDESAVKPQLTNQPTPDPNHDPNHHKNQLTCCQSYVLPLNNSTKLVNKKQNKETHKVKT